MGVDSFFVWIIGLGEQSIISKNTGYFEAVEDGKNESKRKNKAFFYRSLRIRENRVDAIPETPCILTVFNSTILQS